MRFHLGIAFTIATLIVASFASCGTDEKDTGGGGGTSPYGGTGSSGSTSSGSETTSSSGSGTGSTTGSSATTAVAFTDVAPIVKAKCATSGCHDGTTSPNYKDVTEANFKKTSAKTRVTAKTMPPANGKALTDAERKTILDFFGS